MNILMVGGGAREHVICETIKKISNINLYSVMNNLNPGIQSLSKEYLINKETEIDIVIDYAKKKNIDLALIGPEAPLEQGLTDKLFDYGISTCAPTKSAARIETDKEWMRNILKKYDVGGQLKFKTFTDLNKATKFIEELDRCVAIKPIGLTGGKGVKVYGDHFNNLEEACSYVEEILVNKVGGKSKVLIEEKASGEEFTLQALSDGEIIIPLPAVQDHKRLLPDDKGPNTGGMGSYSSSDGLLPFLTKSIYEESAAILQKIIESLNNEKSRFIGPIYGQFMLTAEGPKIIEINARFGDPEAMNVLPLLSNDYIDLCSSMIEGSLSDKKIKINKKSTVCKYVVPEGYGFKSMIGEKINIDESKIKETGAKLYYASVNKIDNDIRTTSSRSLAVVGISDTITNAEKICENSLKYVKGDHIYIRHDIGTENLINKKLNKIQKLNII